MTTFTLAVAAGLCLAAALLVALRAHTRGPSPARVPLEPAEPPVRPRPGGPLDLR